MNELPSRRPAKPTASRGLNTKKSPSIPQETVDYLKAWMMSPEHIAHPYPTEQEKAEIMAETGIELKQLTNWFVNNRKRFWKPRVEAKLFVEEGTGRLIPAGAGSYPIPNHNHALRPRLVEDTHTVSEQGSVASSSSQWNSDDEDDCAVKNTSSLYHRGMAMHASAGTVRREVVDVHVLIPPVEEGSDEKREEMLPTLREMTIKTNVKKEQVLATFPKCLLQYTVPEEHEHDRRKIQIRRDGEVLRVKKHYLKLYLATRGIHSASSPHGENPIDIIAHSSNNSVNTSFSNESSVKPASKRSISSDSDEEPAPRRRRVSSMNGDEEWRSICQNASDIFCDTLPGLEEAAIMFGYIAQ